MPTTLPSSYETEECAANCEWRTFTFKVKVLPFQTCSFSSKAQLLLWREMFSANLPTRWQIHFSLVTRSCRRGCNCSLGQFDWGYLCVPCILRVWTLIIFIFKAAPQKMFGRKPHSGGVTNLAASLLLFTLLAVKRKEAAVYQTNGTPFSIEDK